MLAVGAIQILILLIGLARAKFLSFAIGTDGYGIIGTVDQIVVTMVSFGSLGLPFVAIKMLSRQQSESQEKFEQAYAGFFAALVSLGILMSLFGVALSLATPRIFGAQLAHYNSLIAVAVVAVPSLMINILLANALAASTFGRRAAVFTLFVQATLLGATIVGSITGGLKGIYIATVVSGSMLTLIASIVYRSALGSPLRGGFAWLSSEIGRERTLLVYAFWSYASTAIYALSLTGLRTSVFSNDGAAAAGLLSAALNLALTVGAVVNPISNLLLTPYLNRVLPLEQKVTAADEFATKMLSVVLLVSLPLILFPQIFMRVLFAPSFLPAASFLFAFVAWQCLAQAVNVYTQLLIGLDDFAFSCAATIVGNAAVFLLAPIVTQRFGIPGGIVLLIAGSAVCGLASAVRLWKKFGATLSHVAFLRLAIALAAVLGSVLLLRSASEVTLAGFAMRLGYAIVVLSLIAVLLNPDERSWLLSVFSDRLKRAS